MACQTKGVDYRQQTNQAPEYEKQNPYASEDKHLRQIFLPYIHFNQSSSKENIKQTTCFINVGNNTNIGINAQSTCRWRDSIQAGEEERNWNTYE